MTNYELVEFAKSKIGTSYVYGMKGAILTLEKYKEAERIAEKYQLDFA